MTLGEWVLILVLVEHTLGAEEIGSLTALKCLNPCFSGTYSRSVAAEAARTAQAGLNPCFSGTYSRRSRVVLLWPKPWSLNPCFSGTYSRRASNKAGEIYLIGVLILVLVEHTLGDIYDILFAVAKPS